MPLAELMQGGTMQLPGMLQVDFQRLRRWKALALSCRQQECSRWQHPMRC